MVLGLRQFFPIHLGLHTFGIFHHVVKGKAIFFIKSGFPGGNEHFFSPIIPGSFTYFILQDFQGKSNAFLGVRDMVHW